MRVKEKAIIKSPEIVGQISGALKEHGRVKITGLGIFQVIKCKGFGEKKIAGKKVFVGDYKKIRFRPTAALKQKICYGKN